MAARVAAIIAAFVPSVVAAVVAAARPGSSGAAHPGAARVVLATAHAARPCPPTGRGPSVAWAPWRLAGWPATARCEWPAGGRGRQGGRTRRGGSHGSGAHRVARAVGGTAAAGRPAAARGPPRCGARGRCRGRHCGRHRGRRWPVGRPGDLLRQRRRMRPGPRAKHKDATVPGYRAEGGGWRDGPLLRGAHGPRHGRCWQRRPVGRQATVWRQPWPRPPWPLTG